MGRLRAIVGLKKGGSSEVRFNLRLGPNLELNVFSFEKRKSKVDGRATRPNNNNNNNNNRRPFSRRRARITRLWVEKGSGTVSRWGVNVSVNLCWSENRYRYGARVSGTDCNIWPVRGPSVPVGHF